MQIIRSAATEIQLRETAALRERMLTSLRAAGLRDPLVPIVGKQEAVRNPFLQTLVFAAEGFKPLLTRQSIDQVDRKSSMLAGPFFTSEEYPIPSNSRGMLLPVIQLDLREMSELSCKDFGDGLLQFWCDPNWRNIDRGFVRIISQSELGSESMTSFRFVENRDANGCPIPENLILNNSMENINVITGYESTGLHSQANYLSQFAYELPVDQFELISVDLDRFIEMTNLKNEFHLFGSFYPIQYSSVDVNWDCLVHFPHWGSEGNAQLFLPLRPRW